MAFSQFKPGATLHDDVLTVSGATRRDSATPTLSVEIAVIQGGAVTRGTPTPEPDGDWSIDLRSANVIAGPAVALGVEVMFRLEPPGFETFSWAESIEVKRDKAATQK